MLLGYARGKVGDLVFTRIDGVQVTRPRNRRPYNPRTNKQLIQRAIMATIMAAYSAGREIFDHSFQGHSVGAGCQRRFLSINANMLRTQLAADYENATPEEALAKVTAPKIQTIIPNQYMVSEGSLKQNFFEQSIETKYVYFDAQAYVENETIAEYAARTGLNAGDIYTIVFITTSKADQDVLFKALGVASIEYDTIYRGSFGWVRFIVKNLAGNTTAMADTTKFSDLFDIEYGGIANSGAGDVNIVTPQSLVSLVDGGSDLINNGYAIGMIKSRRDVDLRSNCTLQVMNADEFGLYWDDILTAWKAGTVEIGSSDLILEGGDE